MNRRHHNIVISPSNSVGQAFGSDADMLEILARGVLAVY